MSEVLTPITRIEEYLDGIVNGGAIPLEPVTRVEQFLDAIANSQTCALTPVTRIEAYLGKISGQSLTLPEPVTRVEMYLAAIAGEDVIVPDAPVTRIEMYLAEWIGGGSPEYATVTGSYVSFVTTRSAPLKELVVDINPVQSGSGDPSPNNVRPISGWTGAQIWVDDTHDTSAQADYNISWQSEAGTVYGGTLTVNEDGSGVLSVTAILEQLKTIDSLGYLQGTYFYLPTNVNFDDLGGIVRIAMNKRGEAQALFNTTSNTYQFKMCNYAKHYFAYNDTSTHWYINGQFYLFMPTSVVGNTAESILNYFKSVKDTAPLSVWFPYKEPVIYNLTPGQVTALLGQNYVWADTGDVSVTYYYPGTTASPIVGVGTVNNMVI